MLLDLSKTFTLVSGSTDPVVATVTTTRPAPTTLSTVAQLTQRIQANNVPSPTVAPESVSLQVRISYTFISLAVPFRLCQLQLLPHQH